MPCPAWAGPARPDLFPSLRRPDGPLNDQFQYIKKWKKQQGQNGDFVAKSESRSKKGEGEDSPGNRGGFRRPNRSRRRLKRKTPPLFSGKSGLILLYGEFLRKKKLKYMKKATTKTGLIGI